MDQRERNEKLLAILRAREQTPAMKARIADVEKRLGYAEHFSPPKKKKTRKVVQEVEIEEEVDENGLAANTQ